MVMRFFPFILLLTFTSLTASRDNVRTVSARLGDNISFDFDVQGATVNWYLGSALLRSDSKHGISGAGSLSITDLARGDSGNYRAEVTLGGNTADVVFQLEVLGFEEVKAVEQEEYKEYQEQEETEEKELEDGVDPLIKLLLGSIKIRHNADFYNKCYDLNTNYPDNDLVTKPAPSLSHCQRLCLEYRGCIAFVYIARSMETGDVRQCVLKGGDVSMMTKQTKQGFTAAKLPCLIAEDGRCYKEGYAVRTELPTVQGQLTHIECQEQCMASSECRAFSYNPLNYRCVHEKQAVIGHTWADTKAVFTKKSCLRATDRSCFTEGYEYAGVAIKTVEAHSMSSCVWSCVSEPECRVFVFIKVGSGRVNSCTLKKSSTDRGMHELQGAVMGDMDCLESKGEQGYYTGQKVTDLSPFDRVNADGREECEKLCNERSECKAFSLHETTCSRYDKVPTRLEPVEGHITGLKESLQMAAGGSKTHISCPFVAPNSLSCPSGQVISIENAMYGRDSRYACVEAIDLGGELCKGDEYGATNMVRGWCQGKTDCSLDLSTLESSQLVALRAELALTCHWKTFMYLQVEYKCSVTNIGVKSACEGEDVQLNCIHPGTSLRIKSAIWGRPTNSICKQDNSRWCGNGKQLDYRGTKARTVSGLQCMRWDQFKPHKHSYFVKDRFPSLDENYCRNPDPEKWGENDGERYPGKAWCYTVNTNVRVEVCPVPDCNRVPCHAPVSETTQKVAQLCEGRLSCNFRAVPQTLQDPCPHIPKYVYLTYYCADGQSTGDYDKTQPLLDVAEVESVVRVLDKLPAAAASECYQQNTDYDGVVLKEYDVEDGLEECRRMAPIAPDANLLVYVVETRKCLIKKVSDFTVKDDAGVISARIECLENEDTARRKRSVVEQQPHSEILNYEDYLKKTTIGYRPKELFENKIPRKQVVDEAMREREGEYSFMSPNHLKHVDDIKIDVIDNDEDLL